MGIKPSAIKLYSNPGCTELQSIGPATGDNGLYLWVKVDEGYIDTLLSVPVDFPYRGRVDSTGARSISCGGETRVLTATIKAVAQFLTGAQSPADIIVDDTNQVQLDYTSTNLPDLSTIIDCVSEDGNGNPVTNPQIKIEAISLNPVSIFKTSYDYMNVVPDYGSINAFQFRITFPIAFVPSVGTDRDFIGRLKILSSGVEWRVYDLYKYQSYATIVIPTVDADLTTGKAPAITVSTSKAWSLV
jgi:hypothetical protein